MYSTLYWLTRLDGIHDLLSTVMVCAGLAGTFLGVFGYLACHDLDMEEKTVKGLRKWFKVTVAVIFLFGSIKTFLPTRNEAILIYGGGKAYEYIKSDTSLQQIPYKTTEYIKVVLEKEIEEIKKQD